MKRLFYAFAVAVLGMCAASCSKEVSEPVSVNKGVYAVFPDPIADDMFLTRALAPGNLAFSWGAKDKIDVFPETKGEQMIYSIVASADNKSEFKVVSFELLDGTYRSFYPTQGAVDDFNAIPVSFVGQVQDGDNNTDHLAPLDFRTSAATIEENSGQFKFEPLVCWFKVSMTFPSACTVESMTYSVPAEVLVANATVDVTSATPESPAAAITATELTSSLTVDLKEPVSVAAGSTLTVYIALVPYTCPGCVDITANCTGGASFSGSRNSTATFVAGKYYPFTLSMIADQVVAPAVKYEKVTSLADVEAGDYVLVCKNGSEYDAFSFNKLMENAEAAASLVSGCADLSAVIGMSSSVSSKLEGNNFVALTDTRNTDTELYIPEDFTGSVISMTGDYVEGAATLTTTDGKYSLGLDKISVALGSGNSAEISAAFNAEDIKTILAALNWKCYDATFGDLVRYVASESNMTQAQLDNALAVFDIAAVVAKETFAEKNMGTLMDITTSTKMIDVFAKYYDNFVVLSKLYKDKDLGLAKPFGFNAATNGFSFSVPAPESVWFTRLQNSLSAAVTAENGSTDAAAWAAAKTSFVNYWKDYDADFQVGDFTAFFSGIARKATDALTIEQFNILAGMDWSKVAALYDARTAEMTKTLASVSLYKKAE